MEMSSFHDSRDHERHPVPAPLLAAGEQVGREQERDRHRLGVPGLPAEPLHRRVEEPGDAEGEGEPRVAEAVTGEEVDRHGRHGEGDGLQEIEELRPPAEPVQRDDAEVGERDVVPEHRHAADGDEALALRQQPDRLVVVAEVEVERGEAGVALPDQPAEHDDPHGDRDAEQPRCDVGTSVGDAGAHPAAGRAARAAPAARIATGEIVLVDGEAGRRIVRLDVCGRVDRCLAVVVGPVRRRHGLARVGVAGRIVAARRHRAATLAGRHPARPVVRCYPRRRP